MKDTHADVFADSDGHRVVVLLAHEDIYAAYFLSRLLTARGCSVIGPVFDPNDLLGRNVSTQPDIIMVGDLQGLSLNLTRGLRERFPSARLAGFETDAHDAASAMKQSSTARELGLDMLLTGALSDSEIISRLQILVGGKCADVCTMRPSTDLSSSLFPVWTELYFAPESAASAP